MAGHFDEAVLELPAAEARKLGDSSAYKEKGEIAELHTQDVNAAIARLLQAGASLARLRIRQPTLEDLFLDLTGQELRA
jgi:ABC-2 type transport system ATP-binding protein